MIRHFHEFFKSKFLAGFCNLSRMCAAPRSSLAQRFTTSRALVSLLISSFSYLCALNVFTLACVVQTDRQVKSGISVWYLLTIVVRVFFTNHKVLISSASLIPSLQTTRWKINQNNWTLFLLKSKVKRNICYNFFFLEM